MPLFRLSVSFVCGVVFGAWFNPLPAACIAFAAAALFLSLLPPLMRRVSQRRVSQPAPLLQTPSILSLLARLFVPLPFAAPLTVFALLFAAALGAARFQVSRFVLAPNQVAWYNDHDHRIRIEAWVAGPPETRDTYTLLEVEAVGISAQDEDIYHPVRGRILAKVPPGAWSYGQQLRLDGRLRTPFENEDFSYLDYLAHRGIHAVFDCGYNSDETCAQITVAGAGSRLYLAIYALRERLVHVVYQIFPDPEASLMAGILFGVEGGIPSNVHRAFNDTGTSHVIAISGFNFAIVAGLFSTFFGRLLGRWRGMLAAFIGIVLYALLAGAGAGVVRAAIMGSLSIFAAQIGRRQNGLNSLAFVAALMALHDPHVLWDVSFQLSFMATLGLILYADPLQGWFAALVARRLSVSWVDRLTGPVGEYFLFTLAAQLTTLPLILYYFRRLSLASLLANPLILPAQPAVMIVGGLSALLGLAWLPLGQAAAYVVWPFIVYTIRMVEGLAALPGGALALSRFSPLWLVAFYTLLFAWTFLGARLRSWLEARWGAAPSRLAIPALLGVLLLALLVWRSALAAPAGRLHVTMLDVGDGDAFLIQTPSGRAVLIDGGPSPSMLSDALGRRLPVGPRALDWWVIAAADETQLAALPPALERFPPQQVLWAGPPDGVYSARRLQAALSGEEINVISAQTGHILDLGRGAQLQVLRATPRGAVLLLVWERFRLLLPVGLDFDAMEALLQDQSSPPVTALFLAASGYAPLNPPEWIERWQPQLTLLSVAAGNYDGRPDPEVIQALQGHLLLRTDRNGWVRLSTDGAALWVQVQKSAP